MGKKARLPIIVQTCSVRFQKVPAAFQAVPAAHKDTPSGTVRNKRAALTMVLMTPLLSLAIALQAASPEVLYFRVAADHSTVTLDSLTIAEFQRLLLEPALAQFQRTGIRLLPLWGEGGLDVGAECQVELRGVDRCRLTLILTSRLPPCWGAGLAAVSLSYRGSTVIAAGIQDATSPGVLTHQLLHALMGHAGRQRIGFGAIWNELTVNAAALLLRLRIPTPWHWMLEGAPCS
jgi:hypothetical protein